MADRAENSEPKWVPVNGSHAIQMAYASIAFAQPVTAVIWNNVLSAARAVAATEELTVEVPIQSMMLQIGPGVAQIPAAVQQNAGLVFQSHAAPNLAGEKFLVQPDQIRFETSSYTRWVGFRAKLQSLFSTVLPAYFTAVNLGQISLEYTDVFYWSDVGDADCRDIVDQNSRLVASAIMQPRGLWHSHSGWFDNEHVGSRRLSNADITVADAIVQNQQRRAINIRTHEATHFLLGQDGQPVDGQPKIEDIIEKFDDHHNSLKSVLNKILTPAARDMISLGVSDA